MNLEPHNLDEVVATIFGMFELPLGRPSPDCGGFDCASRWSVIDLETDAPLQVFVGLTEPAVQRFGEAFSSGDPNSLNDLQFLDAVVAELANVLGGSILGMFDTEGRLGLPNTSDSPKLVETDMRRTYTWDEPCLCVVLRLGEASSG